LETQIDVKISNYTVIIIFVLKLKEVMFLINCYSIRRWLFMLHGT